MSERHRTILLRCDKARVDEAEASETIYPGALLKLASTGKVSNHNVSGGVAERAFAIENDLAGMGTDLPYSITDLGLPYPYSMCKMVQFIFALPGDKVAARLKTGYAYTKGQFLMSAGDGTLIPYVAPTVHVATQYPEVTSTTTTQAPDSVTVNTPIAVVQEDLDLQAVATSLVAVRVL